jgi:GNAT superfamily N-acetyltransferase
VPDIDVRVAVATDAADLEHVELLSGRRTAEAWRQRIARYADDPRRLMLVGHLDGRFAGTAEAVWLDEDPESGAPAGFVLAGVNVLESSRRHGVGLALTRRRLAWIAERAATAWYFASSANHASIAMHADLGFVEVLRAPRIHGVDFASGEGVLLRSDLVVAHG